MKKDRKTALCAGREVDTKLVTGGRSEEAYHGFMNPPVFHASTVLYPDADSIRNRRNKYVYGRRGTPTSEALENAISELEGGFGTKLTPSGMAAISTALLSFTSAGDHVLVSDSVYRPTRLFCDTILARYGVETSYFDPLCGADIRSQFQANTRLVFAETPGSQSFEVQDIPAIVEAAHASDILVAMDNTWATPLFFRPLDHGVDISILAATKYVGGHSDLMLGTITVGEALWPQLHHTYETLGLCVGPDDIYLGLRGLRTMGVRLRRHMASGLEIATWLGGLPEVAHVLHPGLPGTPGHDLWKRDFSGCSGLFSIILEPVSEKAVDALLDNLEYFGMGYSCGGYESLIVPFDPTSYRTATQWPYDAPALRLHVGLEDPKDLKRDLEAGFACLRAAR